MPVGKGSVRETIALVSMADGSEIQRFNKPESYDFVLRFGPDGRSFSIDGSLALLTYRLDRKRVVTGKSVSVRVDLGGRRYIKKKQTAQKLSRRLSETIT